jgi:hypothetical protein
VRGEFEVIGKLWRQRECVDQQADGGVLRIRSQAALEVTDLPRPASSANSA